MSLPALDNLVRIGQLKVELLPGKGYIVYGTKRRTSLFNTDRLDHLDQGCLRGCASSYAMATRP